MSRPRVAHLFAQAAILRIREQLTNTSGYSEDVALSDTPVDAAVLLELGVSDDARRAFSVSNRFEGSADVVLDSLRPETSRRQTKAPHINYQNCCEPSEPDLRLVIRERGRRRCRQPSRGIGREE